MSNYIDYDFIGFTYNGKHSIKDLGIYRTSSSDRYETNLTPNITEKTASVEGQIGQYYFGTKVDTKIIPVSFAFDNLSEEKLFQLKKVFNGDGIHDLIFDEEPYKVYSAKVTGTAQVKHLCFEVNGSRVYRGEGNIQFTCFYPYAHTLNTLPEKGEFDVRFPIEYVDSGMIDEEGDKLYKPNIDGDLSFKCGIVLQGYDTIKFEEAEVDSNFAQTFIEKITLRCLDETGYKEIVLPNGTFSYQFPVTTKKIIINEITYHLVQLTYIDVGIVNFPHTLIVNSSEKVGNTNLTYETEYDYSDKTCYESTISQLSGKVLNHYSIVDYPNKWQWASASGLPLHIDDGKNHGDIPTHFILSKDGPIGSVTEEKVDFKVGELTITIPAAGTQAVIPETIEISGTWTFNEIIDTMSLPTETVEESIYSYSEKLITDKFEALYYEIEISDDMGDFGYIVEEKRVPCYYIRGGWQVDKSERTFTVEGTQTISGKLYAWLINNATKEGGIDNHFEIAYIHYKNLTWDSKTGLVTANKDSNTSDIGAKPIPFSGNSVGTIPVRGIDEEKITLNGATLSYDYWYY